jgi:prepilin-type N-terminal cleavage/methylation domain-containing protein
MSHRRSQRQVLGFTLVELLVVIGILGLLISILLPSLQKARQQSYRIQCIANLRSLGLGLMMYANDHKGFVAGKGNSINGVGFTPQRIMYPWFGSYDKQKRLDWDALSPNPNVRKYVGGGDPLSSNGGIANPWVDAGMRYACPINMNRQDCWNRQWGYGFMYWVKYSAAKDASNICVAGDAYRATNDQVYTDGGYPVGDTPDDGGISVGVYPEKLYPAAAPPKIWFGHINTATILLADGHAEFRRRNEFPVLNDSLLTSNDGKMVRYPGYQKFYLGFQVHQ